MGSPYQQFSELRPQKKVVVNMLQEFNSILEVGAQWGENLVAVREKFPDKKIVGLDADWDGITEEAKKQTGLDLRVGTVLDLPFNKEEFDVVFTNALFCMLSPDEVKKALGEIIRVAKKQIILIELETTASIGVVRGGRTGANWVELLKEYGLNATREKIPQEVWEVEPWLTNGYIYNAKKN